MFLSTQHVPKFYKTALDDPEVTPQVAEQVTKRTRELLTVIEKEIEKETEDVSVQPYEWSETVTERECNAWLAYEFPKLFPDAEQEGLSDLRVHFEDDRILFGCRLKSERFSGIVSVALRPQIDSPNQLAIEVLSARVGQVPLPLQTLIDEAYQEAREEGVVDKLQIDWQPAGDSTAEGVLTVSSEDSDRWAIEVLAVQLDELSLKILGRVNGDKEGNDTEQIQELDSSVTVD